MIALILLYLEAWKLRLLLKLVALKILFPRINVHHPAATPGKVVLVTTDPRHIPVEIDGLAVERRHVSTSYHFRKWDLGPYIAESSHVYTMNRDKRIQLAAEEIARRLSTPEGQKSLAEAAERTRRQTEERYHASKRPLGVSAQEWSSKRPGTSVQEWARRRQYGERTGSRDPGRNWWN